MSQQALQKLVGTAVVDRRFREGFLNGARRRLLTPFRLAQEEQETVLSIQAETVEGFAAELERRLFSPARHPGGRPRSDEWWLRPAHSG